MDGHSFPFAALSRAPRFESDLVLVSRIVSIGRLRTNTMTRSFHHHGRFWTRGQWGREVPCDCEALAG